MQDFHGSGAPDAATGIEPHRVTPLRSSADSKQPHPKHAPALVGGARENWAWVLKAVPSSKQATKNGSDHARSGPLFISTALFDLLVPHLLTLLLIDRQFSI
jgi:hypothetical protein